MSTRPGLVAVLAALAFVIGGCKSAPARLYALNPTASAVGAALPVSVRVGPVTIPAVVNSARVMLTVGPNELRGSDFDRWAAPLHENLASVVAADLGLVLGSARVLSTPTAAGPDPDYRVGVDVIRFDSLPKDGADLDALWTVRRVADNVTVTGRTAIHEAAGGEGVGRLAAAHSRNLARLSEDIAVAIRQSAASAPAAPAKH